MIVEKVVKYGKITFTKEEIEFCKELKEIAKNMYQACGGMDENECISEFINDIVKYGNLDLRDWY